MEGIEAFPTSPFSGVGFFVCANDAGLGGCLKKHIIQCSFALFVLNIISAGVVCAEPASPLGFMSSKTESYIISALPQNTSWQLSLMSLESNEVRTSGNATGSLMRPASLVKLLVSAAVLDADSRGLMDLGTTVSYKGNVTDGVLHGDIYLKGRGNALLSLDDLEPVIKALSDAGVKEVRGNIVSDDTFFDIQPVSPDRAGPAYAPAGALGFDLHTVVIEREVGAEAQILPPNEDVRILQSDIGKKGMHVRQVGDLVYQVDMRGPFRVRSSLADPSFYAAGAFKAYLVSNGINVSGDIIKGETPSGASLLVSILAKPLKEIVRLTNHHSINVMAENLLYALGAAKYGSPGNKVKGIKAVRTFLEGLETGDGEYSISDGSGLSIDNGFPGEFWVNFLSSIKGKEWFEAFYESLPEPGNEGTLSHVSLPGGKVRAKTARTESVYGLAGYFLDEHEGLVAFSLVVNAEGADMLSGMTGPFLFSMAGGQ